MLLLTGSGCSSVSPPPTHVAGLPRKLPSARWKLWPPSLDRKMNDCVVLKPNGMLEKIWPVPSIATSGSKPGWKFDTTVGVANSAARAASVPRTSRAAASSRPARTRIADSLRGSREMYALPGLGRAAGRAGHRGRHGGLPVEAARARVGADVLGLGRVAAAL